ncbi:hypothetical protein C0T31_05550 [Dysgonamonadaceae bacterium]|nr:hypothetical protein C0T31_05550 [Dysgonamonadaceae bacterium]
MILIISVLILYRFTYEKEQIFVFEEQLRWSIEKELPVSIHSRNASQEVLQSIRKVGAEKLKGVFHSFAGTFEELSEILQLPNFYVGINGIVTFKNSNLAETLRHCPIERLVIETDAPYLSPVPFRGKRNEPSYISAIVNKLSTIYNLEQEEIAEITKKKCRQTFPNFFMVKEIFFFFVLENVLLFINKRKQRTILDLNLYFCIRNGM